jgi:DNA-binding NarL/FixJ family response regulator
MPTNSHNCRITIILADDHKIVRQGIRSLLEFEPDFQIICEAADGAEAMALTMHHKPDVLVTDLSMPYYSGIELAEAIQKNKIKTKTVVLSMHRDEPYVIRALKAGASCYILKDYGFEHVATAIRHAVAGKRYVSPSLTMPF